MESLTNEISTRELRGQLSDVLGRAMYAGERIGVTRNGKLAAVVVSVADL
jgi:prevent-host-death family protein